MKWAKEDREFLVEERARKARIEEEERARKAHIEEEVRAQKARIEDEERERKIRNEEDDRRSGKEESDRKHALAMKQLEVQELSDKRKQETEHERLQVVRDTGGHVALDVSRRSIDSSRNRVSAKLPQLEIPKFREDKLK